MNLEIESKNENNESRHEIVEPKSLFKALKRLTNVVS